MACNAGKKPLGSHHGGPRSLMWSRSQRTKQRLIHASTGQAIKTTSQTVSNRETRLDTGRRTHQRIPISNIARQREQTRRGESTRRRGSNRSRGAE